MLGSACPGEACFADASQRIDQEPIAPSGWTEPYGFKAERDPAKGGLIVGVLSHGDLMDRLERLGVAG